MQSCRSPVRIRHSAVSKSARGRAPIAGPAHTRLLDRGALPRNIIAQARALALTGTRANQHKRIKLTFSVNGCIGYTILRTICDEPLIYKSLKRSFHTTDVFHALLLFGIVLAINFGVLYKLIESALKLGKSYPQSPGTTRWQVWLCALDHNRWHWAPISPQTH